MLGGWAPVPWEHVLRAKKETGRVDFAEVCTITIKMAGA